MHNFKQIIKEALNLTESTNAFKSLLKISQNNITCLKWACKQNKTKGKCNKLKLKD